MYLKERETAILQMLLNSNKPRNIKDIAIMNGVSERTIRYDIEFLNVYLRKYKAKIKKDKKSGFFLDANENNLIKIRQDLKNSENDNLVKSNIERKNYIISRLLLDSDAVTITSMADALGVSRTSLNNTMKEIYEWLKEIGISVTRKTNYGIKLKYTERQLRKAIYKLCNNNENKKHFYSILIEKKNNNTKAFKLPKYLEEVFCVQDLSSLIDLILLFEKKLSVEFTDKGIVDMLVFLAITINRIRKNCYIEMSSQQLQSLTQMNKYKICEDFSRELSKEFKIEINKEETANIFFFTLGVQKNSRDGDDSSYEYVENIAKEIVEKVEKYIGVNFGKEQRAKLLNGLILHLNTAVFKAEYDPYEKNPLLSVIRNKYPILFEATKKACVEVTELYQIEMFTNDEIAYLIMHIGATFENTRVKDKRVINVAILCCSGIGTSRMLSSRLTNEFPQINVIEELSILDLDKIDDLDISLLITTIGIGIETNKPVIAVSPLLEKEDIRRIENILQIHRIPKDTDFKDNINETIEKIVNIVHDYGIINDEYNLRKDLFKYFAPNTIDKDSDLPCLSDMITENMIEVNYEAKDWEDAVRQAGKLLLNSKRITQNYIEEMVNAIKNYGPYVVISEGIAIPHSGIDAGVIETGMSLLILKHPVCFGNQYNDPVKLVFALCTVDSKTHIRSFSDLGLIAGNKKNFELLCSAKDKKEAHEILKNICADN